MKNIVLYRILGILINIVCFLIAINLLLSIPLLLSQPFFLLFFFILFCVVLYAWFANSFYKKIILQDLTVKKKMKEWLLVNALVSFVFSLIIIIPGITLLSDPDPFFKSLDSLMKQSGASSIGLSNEQARRIAIGELWFLVIFCVVLSIHIIWTYKLVKKKNDHFVDEA
ncbi:MAG: hypothetical protein JSS67_10265 [Bacteroidetes bacterium]|nr:hypothetical protein [Bacteroidota bacterium]